MESEGTAIPGEMSPKYLRWSPACWIIITSGKRLAVSWPSKFTDRRENWPSSMSTHTPPTTPPDSRFSTAIFSCSVRSSDYQTSLSHISKNHLVTLPSRLWLQSTSLTEYRSEPPSAKTRTRTTSSLDLWAA